jgi:hypothetical protein
MMAGLGLAGSMPEAWLASGRGGMELTWTGVMRARLHLDNAGTLLSVRS